MISFITFSIGILLLLFLERNNRESKFLTKSNHGFHEKCIGSAQEAEMELPIALKKQFLTKPS
jgi:hypothetical protein